MIDTQLIILTQMSIRRSPFPSIVKGLYLNRMSNQLYNVIGLARPISNPYRILVVYEQFDTTYKHKIQFDPNSIWVSGMKEFEINHTQVMGLPEEIRGRYIHTLSLIPPREDPFLGYEELLE